MSDDDLIRRGDAKAAIRAEAWPEDGTYPPEQHDIQVAERATVEVCEYAIAALPAVTARADALSVGEAEATRLMLGAQKRMRQYKDRAEAAEAKVARLVEALTLAANRLSRRAVEYVPGSRLFIETGEWADEARAIIAEVQG